MYRIQVRTKRDRAAITAFLRAKVGPMVNAKAEEVLAVAKANCPKGDPPKLANTGRTRRPLRSLGRGKIARSVVFGGAKAPYALYVHEGHGPITPDNGRFLAWRDPNVPGGWVYAKRVRAHPPRPFLMNALVAVCRGWRINRRPVG